MASSSWSMGSIILQGKVADDSSLQWTDSAGVKGLFIFCSLVGNLHLLSCTGLMLAETVSVGEPGLLLERFVMCMQERQRKGGLGSQPVGSECSAVCGLGTYKRGRKGRKEAFSWIFAWASSSVRTQTFFKSPKSWMPWDWQSPLNWAPSEHLHCGKNGAKNSEDWVQVWDNFLLTIASCGVPHGNWQWHGSLFGWNFAQN